MLILLAVGLFGLLWLANDRGWISPESSTIIRRSAMTLSIVGAGLGLAATLGRFVPIAESGRRSGNPLDYWLWIPALAAVGALAGGVLGVVIAAFAALRR